MLSNNTSHICRKDSRILSCPYLADLTLYDKVYRHANKYFGNCYRHQMRAICINECTVNDVDGYNGSPVQT